MAKAKSPTVTEYWRNRSRIQHTIRRYINKGYVVSYELPPIPKVITEASVRRLAKITPKVIRRTAIFVEQTGEIKPAEQAFKQQRSEASRKAVQTRKQAKELGYKSFEDQYLPQEKDIIAYNIAQSAGRFLLTPDELENVLEFIQNAETSGDWESKRSRKSFKAKRAKEASENAANKLVSKIQGLISEEVTINPNTDESTFFDALEQTLFGYGPEEVRLGFSQIMRFLNGGVVSAEEAKEYEI